MTKNPRQAIQQTTGEIEDPSLNTKLSATYLDLKAQTLCNWRHLRRGPIYHKIGGRIVYKKSDLDRFLAAGRVDPSGVVNDLLDGGQKEKSKRKVQNEEQIDDSFETTVKTLEKAIRAAKRSKYESISKEAILEDIDALRNIVALTPRTTKRQTELQQSFFQVDEDLTNRAAFHVENIKIGDQMRVGDKLTSRGKVLTLKGGKVLDVRVVVEKK